jgi:hypothetical protein
MRALYLAVGLFSLPASAMAETNQAETRPALALGINLDLLPTVLSAINGRVGYAPQAWIGIDHFRARLVAAHLEPPNAFAFADDGFRNPRTTVLASILDYTFGDNFDGPWIGAGFEVWWRSIDHYGVSGSAHWTSALATLGGGFIWRVAGNFFIDPWVGAHATLNPETIALGAFRYHPMPVSAEASIKLGWFTPL